ncbi:MAG TPA: carboxypeptidase regulatory-like domain-containing protein [archaeon]|nr:carboxypeptidase regulatory-like domain-containing protein [archaeon]
MFKKSFGFPVTGLLVALAALLFWVAGYAQLSTSKIEGTVKDKDTGQPLAGAQVTIEGTRLGNVTNADGYYFILNVPPGHRNITITFTGYQKTTIANQLILAGQTTTVNADLSSTIVELTGITVQGEAEPMIPRDQTVSKQRMTVETIAETPVTKLEDLMVLQAGVQSGGQDAFGRGLRIRGGRLGEEAMVVDGVTVRNYTADPFRSGLGWVWEQEEGSLGEDTTPLEFSTGAVEEVDILTGGFQAEYGNAQSGIINIVTKEGTERYRGSVRVTTDELNPRTADWGYNQVVASLGGPIPGINNLFFHVSGEIQGMADRSPTHADEGFRGVNEDFVRHLNQAVRNDPVLGTRELQPVFTLEKLQLGREFYASKTGKSPALFTAPNPVRLPGNWGDRTLASGKITYSPIEGLKFIATGQFSRPQNSYPTRDDGSYFYTGIATPGMLPDRAWELDPDTIVYMPQSYARRTRTANYLAGVDWDFYRTAQRHASLQLRYTNFRTQDVSSATLKENYYHDNTFMSWAPHDIPFEIETFPNREYPTTGSPDAAIYFPNGWGGWERNINVETPFRLIVGTDLYWLSYFYLREHQSNYKLDVDFQWDRWNRAKIGGQYLDFSNLRFDIHNMSGARDVHNQFAYHPRMYAFYLQNRTDVGDFVLDYGIRYDRFDPKDNWGFRYGDQWGESYFPKNISEWSPRFDVAFPVTDKSQLRFAYGVFTQLPQMPFIYSGSNPGGLEYSRTDAFEAGLSYLLSQDIVVDMVAYYRDVDGNLAEKSFFRDYYAWHMERRFRDYWEGYTNRDNGNIKGLDLSLRKRFANNFAFNLMYTLQFSRTTGSVYNTTSAWDQFLDPATGETYTPPDEIRPIDGDVTHKMTVTLNYMFPEDFKTGTLYNTILKDFRTYAVFTLMSGSPAYERIRTYGTSGTLTAAEDMRYMTWRGGRPVGGVNYFRGRWQYDLTLRLSKSFRLGATRRLGVFAEIYNMLNLKLPTPYPSGLSYEGYYWVPGGGVEMTWSDDLTYEQKVWFNSDYNQDGVLTLMEQAQGAIAYSVMEGTMDKKAWGNARQIRCGLDFSF